MSSSSGGPHAGLVGSLHRMDAGKGAVRMEDVYDTGIDDLWSALTEPSRLARWVAEVDGDLREGGAIHARFTSAWEGPGRVDVCEAPTRLAVTLSPGTADETVIEALLGPEGEKTRLVIEERGIPMDELAAFGAGWQAHVEDLAAHLASAQPADWHDRWTALSPDYQAMAASLT